MQLQKQETRITFDKEKVDLIKRTVAEHATDSELEMFMHLANKYQLDPFAKQIWFIKYKQGDKPQIFTSRDGYLQIAHASGMFDGIESYTIDDEKGNPIKAVCIVHRKDMTRPIKAEIKVAEYKQNSPVWNKYPSAMAIKVAEVNALKRAFSISGLLTQEEIDPATLTVEPQSEPKFIARPVTISKPQAVRLFAIAKSEKSTDGFNAPSPRWTDEQLKDFLGSLGYSSSSDIKVSDYEEICEYVASHAGHFTDSPDQVKMIDLDQATLASPQADYDSEPWNAPAAVKKGGK
jgi:phage recombination protein Bet